MSDKEEAAPAADPLDRAADRLRDSARWLLAGFGAVAVVIFAGLTVADFGKLDPSTPDFRFWIALVGGALAIVGIVAALTIAMGLAGASTTYLEDLRDDTGADPALDAALEVAHRDPALAPWKTGVRTDTYDSFLDAYRDAYEDYLGRLQAFTRDPARSPDPAGVHKSSVRLNGLTAVAGRILRTVGFLRLQYAFDQARRRMASWVTVTAIGAMAFGWATTGVPEQDTPTVTFRPVAAVLRPDDEVRAELNRQLLAPCEFPMDAPIPVIVVGEVDGGDGADEGGTDAPILSVITVPRDGCDPAQASVPSAQVSTT